ncbi:MAG TPA: hypothetical protein VI893_08895 [Thermoplasmata archaeon]|nr:hypothetical protein [Thermoplasmata archaeon]
MRQRETEAEGPRAEVLGLDIGGVILDARTNDSDTSLFGPRYLEAKAVRGAFDGIRELVDRKFGERVHLVSKCGVPTQRRTRAWMDHHDFFDRTGILPENLHFCLTREGKAPICRRLRVSHFVDDRLEILGFLADAGVPNLYLFNAMEAEVASHSERLSLVRVVNDWDALVKSLLA